MPKKTGYSTNIQNINLKADVLESFPAWQESRKLMNLVKDTRIIGEEDGEKYIFRNTAARWTENIFFAAAEAFRQMKRGGYNKAENTLDDLVKFKTAIYMLFDRNKINRDDFSAIIMQASRVISLFEDIAMLAEKNKKKIEKRKDLKPVDGHVHDAEEHENENKEGKDEK
jgi:hypothetical protein